MYYIHITNFLYSEYTEYSEYKKFVMLYIIIQTIDNTYIAYTGSLQSSVPKPKIRNSKSELVDQNV